MAVDVSKIPNNDKFDPVRKALLNLQSQLEQEGQIAYDGEITISAGTNLTGGGSFTVNQSGNSTITLNADSQTDENFTTALKNKLDGIEAGAEVNTVDSVNTQTGDVVLDADDISDASTTNKFTTQAEIDKLAGIEDEANNYVLPTASDTTLGGVKVGFRLSILDDVLSADVQTDQNFTTELKNKLDGIESGATATNDPAIFITDLGLAFDAGTNAAEVRTLLDVDQAGTNAVDSVNGETGIVVLDADDIDDASTTNKFTTQAEIDKLAGIEAGAEVNDVDSVNGQTGVVVLDTDDVQESATPTNKYYTEVRFNASLATKDTDDLSEGATNLYYTDTRFDNRFDTKDTDDLDEGDTNFYYTEARFDASLATKDTDDLAEGTNLYYTDARARAAISDGDGLDYNATTGVMSHTDTSSQSSVNNSNGIVIQDVDVDTFGHVTSLGSVDLDLRYPQVAFKTIEANTGSEVADTKTDTLAIKGGNLVNTSVTDVSGKATVTVDVSLTDVRFDENGDKIARGYLYWQGSTVPTSSDLPASSTFNFETNIITINDADWSEIPPTTGYSMTTYYITRYSAINSGAGTITARPVTYADPQDTTGFEGVVTFSSLSDELGAGGLTIIDGGRIQTGEISSVGFNAGSTPTDYSTDGTLISLDSGNIISENFKIINGDADFRGDFSAATATIGSVEINTTHSNVFDVNLDAYIDRVIADGGTLEAIDGIYALSDDVNYALYSKNIKIDENGNAAFSGKLRAADGTFTGNLIAATGTFGGELTAATGSFAGELSAATGTFAGALSAATGTFAGSLSAATGTFSGDISAATGTFSGGLDVSDGTFAVDSSTGIITAGNLEIKENEIEFNAGDNTYTQAGKLTFNDDSSNEVAKMQAFAYSIGGTTKGGISLDTSTGGIGKNPFLTLSPDLGWTLGDLNLGRINGDDDAGDSRLNFTADKFNFGGQTFDYTSTFSATSGSIPLLGGLKVNWIRRTNVSNQVSGTWASAFTTVFGAVATKGNNSSTYETANNAATVSYTNTNYYLDVNDNNKTVFIIAIGI